MAKKKKAAKKKPQGNRRGRQLGASPAELAKARAAGKRQGKTGGRPKKTPSELIKTIADPTDDQYLDAALDHAQYGAQRDDIAVLLGLEKRLTDDGDFRNEFDKVVEFGVAQLRTTTARSLVNDANAGKVTAQQSVAKAYLEAFMDETPMRDFAAGTHDRVFGLIEKAKRIRKERAKPKGKR